MTMISHSPAPHVPCDVLRDPNGVRSISRLIALAAHPHVERVRAGDVLARRFELTRLAGSGGMAEVFEAIDRSTGERVAVKVLSEVRPLISARFDREALLLATFRHADIVGHVAHGTMPSGQRYLAMDWLAGEDLAHLLERRRLSVAETLTLGARLSRALGVLHARGVVHRDIKPANVFLVNGRVDQPKVIDLGLAQGDEPSGGTRLTVVGALIGTMGYIAPEQVQTEDAVDARADVFSLGCVLFKCLTGASPFQADRMVRMLAKLLHEEAPRLRDRCPEAPAALDALIARMLAKNPAERPRDGREVAAVLQAVADAARVPRRLLARAIFIGGEAAVYLPAGSSGVVEAGISTTHLVEVRRRGDRDGASGERELDGVAEQVRWQLKLSTALYRDRFGALAATSRVLPRGDGGGDRAAGDQYRARPRRAPEASPTARGEGSRARGLQCARAKPTANHRAAAETRIQA